MGKLSVTLTILLIYIYILTGFSEPLATPFIETLIIFTGSLGGKFKGRAIAVFAVIEAILYIDKFGLSIVDDRAVALLFWVCSFFIWEKLGNKGLIIMVLYHFLWNFSTGNIFILVLFFTIFLNVFFLFSKFE